MIKRVKKILSLLFVCSLLGGLAGGAYLLIKDIAEYLGSIPKELGAPLVTAAATIIAATTTIMIGRYFERKRELDALFREKKMEVYDEFLKIFFDHFFSTSDDSPTQAPEDLVTFLREFMRKLILWSGPEPIAAFLKWKDHLAKGRPDAQTMFLTEQFLLALRADRRDNNKGIPKGFYASFVLRNGNLFLAMAKSDPNVTLAQLAELEKILGSESNG